MACRTFTVVWNHRLSQVLNHFHYPTPKAGGCTLRDLMPDNLRWSWCNTDRNKVHNECHALEILKPSPAQTMEKWSSTKLVPGAKKIGDCWSRDIPSVVSPKSYNSLLEILWPSFRNYNLCHNVSNIFATNSHQVPKMWQIIWPQCQQCLYQTLELLQSPFLL